MTQSNNSDQVQESKITTPQKHIIVLIHGIRTQAEWQDVLRQELSKIQGVEVRSLGYGWFDAIRFLTFGRKAAVTVVKNKLRSVEAYSNANNAKMSIIAHSFGTYITASILNDDPHLKLYKLILCGSVVKQQFNWGRVQYQVESKILNCCGTNDIWPVLAKIFTFGYGTSGRYGFKDGVVEDRYYDVTHSEFLTTKFCNTYWRPYLEDQNNISLPDSVSSRLPESYAISILSKLSPPLIALFVFALSYVYVFHIDRFITKADFSKQLEVDVKPIRVDNSSPAHRRFTNILPGTEINSHPDIYFEAVANQIVSAGQDVKFPVIARNRSDGTPAKLEVDRLPNLSSFDLNKQGMRDFYWQTTSNDQGEHIFRFTAISRSDPSQRTDNDVLIVVGDPSLSNTRYYDPHDPILTE